MPHIIKSNTAHCKWTVFQKLVWILYCGGENVGCAWRNIPLTADHSLSLEWGSPEYIFKQG